MRVVLFYENSHEQKMAQGLTGPMRRWITPVATAIWQGRGNPTIDISARPKQFDVDTDDEYVAALERAVFKLDGTVP